MKKKSLIALLVVLSLGLLAGCGGGDQGASGTNEPAADQGDKVISIGATPTPSEEVLVAMKDAFAEEGYELDIHSFSDFVQPNKGLISGELDANYFQHLPYMENFNEENGSELISVGEVHFIPMALFPGQTESVEALKDGAKIAVPNDTTNEARALLLLQEQGIITLKEDVGIMATKNDIVDNLKNVEIVELEAAQVPRALADVDLAVINGNYALLAEMPLSDALAVEAEDSLAAQTYAVVLTVRPEDAESEKTKALVKVLTSDACKAFITEKYQGAVMPV